MLYTCKVNIAADAASGDYPLTISGVILSDPNGNLVARATGVSGTVTVSGGVEPTLTPTRTLTPTSTRTPTSTPTRTATPCVGTCHGGSAVVINDLLVMVNIALGNTAVSACSAGDINRDGAITINEVLGAVNNALYGCGVAPPTLRPTYTRTPTPTPSASPTPTASPTPKIVHIDIGTAVGAPGGTVRVAVNIRSSGFGTVATGNDLNYRNDLFDLDVKGCTVNAAIRKTLVVSELPPDPVASITSVRLL